MIGALIVRQWRGLIPFGYSALGGAALTIGLSHLLSALCDYWLQLFSLHSVRAATAFLAFQFLWVPLILVACALWLVGSWRAAARARPWLRYSVRAGIGIFAMLLGIFMWFDEIPRTEDIIAFIQDDPSMGKRFVRYDPGSDQIVVSGYISLSMARDFRAVLMRHPKATAILLSDSIGGRYGPAQEIALLIRDRKLDTRVRDVCISACTIAFISGRRRYVFSDARLGFHGGSVGGIYEQSGTGLMAQTARSAGISETFIGKVYSGLTLWYPTIAEMQAAHVVTDVIP